MKAVSVRALALASLASLAMATSSNAVTILQFAQTNPADFVTATAAGATTTLTTNSLAVPGSIPIQITNLGGTPQAPPLPALETFVGVTSTGTATTTAGTIEQLFSGTIRITNVAGTTNVLTTVFSNATLSGLAGGGSASLVGSRPPQTVTFTSDIPAIQALIAGNPPENFSLSFSNIVTPPGLSIAGTTIASFTAQNSGTFATGTTAVVPEPSGIVMAGTAIIAGFGCFGWRRRQSSRV